MKKIGITGGIGSGKSIVSRILKTIGYPIYDSDSWAKHLMNNHPNIRQALTDKFGAETYTHEGLNRTYLAQQIFNNRRLRTYIEDQHLIWDTGMNAVESIYKQLVQSPFYAEYMQLEVPTYEDDKRIWRKIYSVLMPENPDLYSALDDLELALDFQGWTTEADMILTYIDKTIKRFNEKNGDNQPLLEMFNSEDELIFAKDLLHQTIAHATEYKTLIASSLLNWEAERIAYMDYIILITALTEIIHFNDIALEISMNEYIELAKEFSGEKSYIFINGILNKIVGDLKKENKIMKSIR